MPGRINQIFPSDADGLIKIGSDLSRAIKEGPRLEDRALNTVTNHQGVQPLLDLVDLKRTQISVDVVEYRAIKGHVTTQAATRAPADDSAARDFGHPIISFGCRSPCRSG
jgi:hypothetical protein